MDRLDERTRDRLAALIVGVALVVGLATIAFGRYESGIRLTTSGEYVVVADVQPRSLATQYGLRPGMVVTELAGVTLVRLPQYVWPKAEPTPHPETGEAPPYEPIGLEPATPTVVDIDPTLRTELLTSPSISRLMAIEPWVLDRPPGEEMHPSAELFDDGLEGIRGSLPWFVLGAALLALVWWWLASGRAGRRVRNLAAPLAVATAMPFLTRPLDATWSVPLMSLGAVLLVAGMLPLALALIEHVEDERDRRLVSIATAGCAIGAVVVGVAAAGSAPWSGDSFALLALVGAVPLIPGLAAAGPISRGPDAGSSPSSGRLLESTEYAVVGATPTVALATDGLSLYPLVLWFGLILLAGRFTIRPLARLASRAALQRDLVVAATEAERARVAADIHDDALQELTLLVHRLDAAGDGEGADIARTVSDRLRAICGDLRLPILDDLGVGPALDWLVLRIERLAGGEVRLDRSDGTRPPADVELAFFRVAQEALANAVKHGRPPIVVRYSTTDGAASLSIDDAGPGIAPDASERADRAGHFGLLNMQQRAEAIGAILDVRRWPAGGTHVALEWRAR